MHNTHTHSTYTFTDALLGADCGHMFTGLGFRFRVYRCSSWRRLRAYVVMYVCYTYTFYKYIAHLQIHIRVIYVYKTYTHLRMLFFAQTAAKENDLN